LLEAEHRTKPELDRSVICLIKLLKYFVALGRGVADRRHRKRYSAACIRIGLDGPARQFARVDLVAKPKGCKMAFGKPVIWGMSD
jgi:hypothetical protein